MKMIRKIELKDLETYIDLAYKAYPSFKDYTYKGYDDFRELTKMRFFDKNTHWYGMYEDDLLIAAMRLFDFKMNFFNEIIDASGLASVAVSLLHKKEKVAYMLVKFYEEYYKEKGIPIAMLLPFKPEFYIKMGYGFGSKINRYRIKASNFPKYKDTSSLKFLDYFNIDEIITTYNEYQKQNHGILNKISDEIYDLKVNSKNIIVGNYNNKDLTGYLIFEFEEGNDNNYTLTNMIIKEFVYLDNTTFKKLLGFINKQTDQINLVQIDICNENFYHIFDNCLNDSNNYIPYGYLETNTQAIGPMYKILDIDLALNKYNYRNYNNVNLDLRLNIINECDNIEEHIIKFRQGFITTKQDNYDVSMTISINHFSSLFIGAISINDLYQYGLIEVDDLSYLDILNLAFIVLNKPQCNTDF